MGVPPPPPIIALRNQVKSIKMCPKKHYLLANWGRGQTPPPKRPGRPTTDYIVVNIILLYHFSISIDVDVVVVVVIIRTQVDMKVHVITSYITLQYTY